MAQVTVPKLHEYSWHPWTASVLSINTAQHMTAVNTVAAATDVTVNTMSFAIINTDYPAAGRGNLKEVNCELIMAFQAVSNALALMTYKWQGRNAPPPDLEWVNLTSSETNVPGANWTETQVMGYARVQTNFNKFPFQVRGVFQCNLANEGSAKINTRSFVRFVYEV